MKIDLLGKEVSMKKCFGMVYVVMMAVILLVGLFGCSDENVSKDVSSIKSRLEKIEDRLSSIEKSSKRVGLLEADLQRLQQSMEAWERAIAARLASASKKLSGSQPKAVEKRNKKKYYVVERGDSLYSVAQKHAMTLDQLCKLNKITAKAVLHPGRKLLVYSK
jgi:LysM repeat protein